MGLGVGKGAPPNREDRKERAFPSDTIFNCKFSWHIKSDLVNLALSKIGYGVTLVQRLFEGYLDTAFEIAVHSRWPTKPCQLGLLAVS